MTFTDRRLCWAISLLGWIGRRLIPESERGQWAEYLIAVGDAMVANIKRKKG